MKIVGVSIIFAMMLVLVVVRPRRWSEAWWTVAGAVAMLAFGFVSPCEASATVLEGKNALLFLLSLLALSLLVGRSGFFDWAAIKCARLSRGSSRALFRNVFILGAIVTAILSLDTTAVMLTPVVLALSKHLKLPAAPYVILCAFVANVGSLALPISNLTNVIFVGTFHLAFTTYASRMVLPQLVALVATFAILRWRLRREIPARFEECLLPSPASLVPSHSYFVACVVVLVVVLVGYFVAPLAGLEPYVVAFLGSAVLVIVGAFTHRVGFAAARELSWGVFPFVIGLFIAVRGVENLGFVEPVSRWIAHMAPDSIATMASTSTVVTLASNLINNLPAALVARGALVSAHASTGTVLAALIGADVGAVITPFGSLATMLVLTLARREGVDVSARRMVVMGLAVVPVVLVATTVALWLSTP